VGGVDVRARDMKNNPDDAGFYLTSHLLEHGIQAADVPKGKANKPQYGKIPDMPYNSAYLNQGGPVCLSTHEAWA
jgi:hypothetical protein